MPSNALVSPASFVHCSSPKHVEDPLHEPWVLGRNGETYCASEVTVRRGRRENKALMRAQREFSTDNAEWQRHVEDSVMTREVFRAPVQAPNGETYELEDYAQLVLQRPDFKDPRNPVALPKRVELIPNRAIQRLAMLVSPFDPAAHPYSLPREPGTAAAARAALATLRAHEEHHDVLAAILANELPADWLALRAAALEATSLAMAEGAQELAHQHALLMARNPTRLLFCYEDARWRVYFAIFWLAAGTSLCAVGVREQVTDPTVQARLALILCASLLAGGLGSALASACLPLEGGRSVRVRQRLGLSADAVDTALKVATTGCRAFTASSFFTASLVPRAHDPGPNPPIVIMATLGGIVAGLLPTLTAPRPEPAPRCVLVESDVP